MTESRILKIDTEFKGLIPPLSPEEYAQLEKNILEEGCRDALVVWNGILLDGHNRYEICQKHDMAFAVESREFDSREEAINWIINNQLGRRNLTPDQQSYLRGKRYNMVKEPQGGDRKSDQVRSSYQNDNLKKTHERIAKELHVGSATIPRDGQFAEAIDTLRDKAGIDPQSIIGIANKQDVIELGKVLKDQEKSQKEPSLFAPEIKDDLTTHIASKLQEAIKGGDRDEIKATAKKVSQESKNIPLVPLSPEEMQKQKEREYYDNCRVAFFMQLNNLLSGISIVGNDHQVKELESYVGEWDRFSRQYRYKKPDVLNALQTLQKNLPVLIKCVESM